MSENNNCDDCLSQEEIARYGRFKWGILGLLLLIPLLGLLLPALAGCAATVTAPPSEDTVLLEEILQQLQQQNQRQNIEVNVNLDGIVAAATATPGSIIESEPVTPETIEITRIVTNTQIVTNVITQSVPITVTIPITQTPQVIREVVTREFVEIPPTPIGTGDACTRFNFEIGRERERGSRGSGWYVMRETNGRVVTSWYALDGWLDSGWQENLAISANTVYVTVAFFPDAGGRPVPMEVINTAPDVPYGWLSNGICHAVELQFPAGYTADN